MELLTIAIKKQRVLDLKLLKMCRDGSIASGVPENLLPWNYGELEDPASIIQLKIRIKLLQQLMEMVMVQTMVMVMVVVQQTIRIKENLVIRKLMMIIWWIELMQLLRI